jgi:hypothetical protein
MIRLVKVQGMTLFCLLMTPPTASATGGARQQRVEPKGTVQTVLS